jgi:hypothetical protein
LKNIRETVTFLYIELGRREVGGSRKCSEAEFKEKLSVWDPMLELTITSPYLRVDLESSFPPQRRGMPTNVSPIIQKCNNQKETGEYKEGAEKEWELNRPYGA